MTGSVNVKTALEVQSPPRVQRVVLPSGAVTWTVLGGDLLPVAPVEQFLEYLRVRQQSPNTVKAYARGLQLWWEFLELYRLAWEAASLEHFGRFLGWLRSGDRRWWRRWWSGRLVSPRRRSRCVCTRSARSTASTISTGSGVGSRLYERVFAVRGRYKPFLEHIARRHGSLRSLVAPRTRAAAPPPTLTPAQIEAIKDACACWDEGRRGWARRLRDRLLWTA